MPLNLDFDQLVNRFGEVIAWHCLAEIERAALIQPQRSVADPEARLSFACRLQDTQHGSANLLAA